MEITANSVYCSNCHKEVAFHYAKVNHRRELIKSILTVGLWLPIWLASIAIKTKVCDGCGGSIIE